MGASNYWWFHHVYFIFCYKRMRGGHPIFSIFFMSLGFIEITRLCVGGGEGLKTGLQC